jgi:hypothetical protein
MDMCLSVSLLVALACSQAASAEMRTLVINGDLNVTDTVIYKNTHLEVKGNVNLLRNGALILDGCLVEIVGKHARQYGYNWRGGTLTTRNTTIGGTLQKTVAQQANFNLDDGLWTATDTTVQYTYGIQFSHETVGRLRATRLKQGPNPDSIIMAGMGDVELTDSTYMIALNLHMRGDKGTLDLPNDEPITRTINAASMPGTTFQLKLKNVTVPDFWFIFFNDVFPGTKAQYNRRKDIFKDANENGTYEQGEGILNVSIRLLVGGAVQGAFDSSSSVGSFAIPIQSISAGSVVQVTLSNTTALAISLSIPSSYSNNTSVGLAPGESRVYGQFTKPSGSRNVGLREVAPVVVPIVPPSLSVATTAEGVIVQWPSDLALGYQLQQSSDMVSWVPLTEDFRAGTAGTMRYVESPGPGAKFFRLLVRKQ